VRANAEMAPLAHRGRKRFFCSAVPKSFTGWGTPIAWCADNNAATEAAVLSWNLHAECAEFGEPSHYLGGVLTGGVDLCRVDLVAKEVIQLTIELPELRTVWFIERESFQKIHSEVSEEHIAHEALSAPDLLSRLFGDSPRFFRVYHRLLQTSYTRRQIEGEREISAKRHNFTTLNTSKFPPDCNVPLEKENCGEFQPGKVRAEPGKVRAGIK
jgi:hypothetical protein